ncbi:MAG: site-specific integrase [Clostridia bacterium]|nr:site-specific integrase [Clostridia bacterium]
MSIKKIKNPDQFCKQTISEAVECFLKKCRLKNLSPRSLEFYEDTIKHFTTAQRLKYIEEISQDVLDEFVLGEMNRNLRITSINNHLRGIRAFLNFCFKQKYLEPFPIALLKEDETVKDPYTDEELIRLLKQPQTDNWVEWRSWAVVNMFIATGIRAGTLISIKICDLDFENSSIRLRKLKNRKQQFIPMSSSLKSVLDTYLKTWDWNPEDYLFPSQSNTQMESHSIYSSIRKYNVSRNVMKTSIHLFRHTFAKNYIIAGGGMMQLQAILGHSTMNMTRHYVNLYGSDIQKDFDLLNPLNRIVEKARQ